jgi:hypothetical protein
MIDVAISEQLPEQADTLRRRRLVLRRVRERGLDAVLQRP